MNNKENESCHKTSINWYPGHMAKTKKEIANTMPLIDIVIEVIDSRIPRSSHIPDLNRYVKNKIMIMVFNKYDLCDEVETNKWIEYYKKLGYNIVKTNSKEGSSYKLLLQMISNLMSEIDKKRIAKGMLPKKAKCLVVGVPNVGKSTLINKLVNKKINDVGNKPGITKTFKTIRINNNVDLVDTPGILWPKIDVDEVAYNLGSMTIIKEEVLPTDVIAVHILKKLNDYYKDYLNKEFGLSEFNEDDIVSAYETISKCKNIPFKEEPDYDKINLIIINSIKQEKIKNITFDRI